MHSIDISQHSKGICCNSSETTALSKENILYTFIIPTLLLCILREILKREVWCVLPPYHLIICHEGQDRFKLILLAHFLANFWVCICLEEGMDR